MRHVISRILIISLLTFVFSFGCGGSSPITGSDSLEDPSIGAPVPAPGDEEANSSGEGGDGDSGDDAVPSKVLIVGSLVGSEGVTIPNTSITFYSNPLQVITDAGGIFQALLEAGQHTFEVTGDTAGDISGTIVVTATNYVTESGQTIGSFVAEVQSAVGEYVECMNLRLEDLGKTVAVNTAIGIYEGTFGDEVDAQGNNLTAIITGNSEMVANVSLDARLSGLWFPSVGAYNHIPYLSKIDDWVKPFQGSFGGIKRGDDYYWFTNGDHWEKPTIEYITDNSFAPIIEITYEGKDGSDCDGATVKEKLFVKYDAHDGLGGKANVLMRDFQVTSPWNINLLCSTSSNSSYSPELALYSRFNPNSTHQLFHQWMPGLAVPACLDDRMYWAQVDLELYTIVMEGMDMWGNKLGMSCTNVASLDEARKIVPDAECFPLSVIGTIAEWEIPTTRRVFVATSGCGLAGVPCNGALDNVETSPTSIENLVKSGWSSWFNKIDTTTIYNSTWRNRYKRWLVSMKMLADKNTGAIIAAPSQEPTYYYSWPRDGVYQALAYIMANKSGQDADEAASFFYYLFNMAQNWDGGWTQAHSSLDGSDLGLPSSPLRLSVEEDQPPTVLWGLWVYWTEIGNLPGGITIADIKEVADYVVYRICPDSGLLWPSLDWHENPYKDIGQSLYTNAAAHAGLLAAAEMVEGEDGDAAAEYRTAAQTIRNGIETRLCDSSSCHSRIKYDPAYIGLLGDQLPACNVCLDAPYSDDEGERIMAFAWPFHLFELGNPRIQSYYADTMGAHDDLSEFSKDKSLWIPRYLYSYLYAREAYANSEVPSGSYKTSLLSDIIDVESTLPDLMTDVGYLMDQYVGDDEGEIFGHEYEGQKLGSAARPLGWSQAMGVLSALAKYGKRAPMLDPPPPPADCMIGSGPCCDGTGSFRPSSYDCGTSTDYGCPSGTSCGDDVKKRTATQYCSGSSSSCDGATTYGGWTVHDYCSSSEKCVDDNPVCQPCSCVCTTTDGPCCDGCNFESSGSPCDTETQYQCEGTGCSDDVEERTRSKSCSGTSAACEGIYGSWSGWSNHESCSSDEKCNSTTFSCYESSACYDCDLGSGPCCDSNKDFRPSSYICDYNIATDYECHWGTSCGDDVGIGALNKYCSGSSELCDGSTAWTWDVHDYCNQYEKCSTSDNLCHENAACCPPISWSANLQAESKTYGVSLTWNTAPDAEYYIITRSDGMTSCPPPSLVIDPPAFVPVFTDFDLAPGECKQYGVYATNSCEEPGGCGGTVVGCRL